MKSILIALVIGALIGITAWLFGADLTTVAKLAGVGAFVILLAEFIRKSLARDN